MSYIRAEDVLPKKLIKTIQQYVDGKAIYIPSKQKKAWGSETSRRDCRNACADAFSDKKIRSEDPPQDKRIGIITWNVSSRRSEYITVAGDAEKSRNLSTVASFE